MAWFYCSSVLYVALEHFYVNLMDSFEKINVYLINTFLGQVSVIAEDMVFLRNKQIFFEKMAWVYCSSVLYIVLEQFYLNLIECF